MRTMRLSLVGVVLLALAGGPGGAVMAQEAADTDAGGSGEVLFDIVVPPASMPAKLGKVNLERQTLEPGFDASIGVDNESMRGRAAYVAEGELQITPMGDAWLWRGEAATGGTPEVVVAGDTAALATGDLIYLPAVPAEGLDAEAVVGLTNPGTVPTTIVGFHVHQVGGGFPGWPLGMSGMAVATDSEPAALERVMADDTTFRLSRVTYAPGSVIVPDEEVAMALAGVESGAVERRTATSDDEFTMGFSAGAGVSLGVPEGVERTWTTPELSVPVP